MFQCLPVTQLAVFAHLFVTALAGTQLPGLGFKGTVFTKALAADITGANEASVACALLACGTLPATVASVTLQAFTCSAAMLQTVAALAEIVIALLAVAAQVLPAALTA
jgi:hypothetical protein